MMCFIGSDWVCDVFGARASCDSELVRSKPQGERLNRLEQVVQILAEDQLSLAEDRC